jgi:hypothetical protein
VAYIISFVYFGDTVIISCHSSVSGLGHVSMMWYITYHKNDYCMCTSVSLFVNLHTMTIREETLFCLTVHVTLQSHLFHLTAGSAALATAPSCHEEVWKH